MNILLSFLQDTVNTPYNIPAYRFWTHYIKNGIAEAGMNVVEVPNTDWAAGLVPYEHDPALRRWKDETWTTTLHYIKANRSKIDVFLTYLYPKQVEIQAIKQIRAMGIPCVNFYCDHVRQFSFLPDEFKVFDYMWVPEYEALPMYKKAGVPYLYLPMPMWVDLKFRKVPATENNRVTFIGSKDNLRAQFLKTIIDSGLPLFVGGNGWQHEHSLASSTQQPGFITKLKNQLRLLKNEGAGRFINYHLSKYYQPANVSIPEEQTLPKPTFDEYVNLTRSSNITLGINRVTSTARFTRHFTTYSRLRDLEAPMLGACYLTEYTEGLAHLYQLGDEVESYKTAGELIYKCNELLKSPARRQQLRAAGQQRALREHSIPQSLNKIKQVLF